MSSPVAITKPPNRLPVIIIADRVRSLYNVGALFRLADGAGIEELWLCGFTGHPRVVDDPRPEWIIERNEREINKTGLSGVKAVPFRYFESLELSLVEAEKMGYHIVALEKTDDSVDYREAKFEFPLALIIGHETQGVAESGLLAAKQAVHLPMAGEGSSLNVSTATAAILYHLLALHLPFPKN